MKLLIAGYPPEIQGLPEVDKNDVSTYVSFLIEWAKLGVLAAKEHFADSNEPVQRQLDQHLKDVEGVGKSLWQLF